MRDFSRVCNEAARAGGQVLIKMRGKITAREKAPADLVTEADIASQRTIRNLVLGAYPDHGFLGEEPLEDTQTITQTEYTWVVDPLDGTTNYVHGMENYCVSVALQHEKEIIVGAIYDPVREKCFSATMGGGAFCNRAPIAVSDVSSLNQALVAASLSVRVQRSSAEVSRFLEVLFRCQALRRFGSAALNLCYVATGSLDAYWATSLKKWDVAAGLLIVREAGGKVTGLDGGDINIDKPHLVATGQEALHEELVAILSTVS